jgi:uncharacterized membrane protein YtjA (UPF0391 family)
MFWLAVLFAILAIIFGFWAFAATVVWVGAKVLFWILLALFILSLLGGALRPRRLP